MFFATVHYQEYLEYMQELGFWVDPIPLIWSKDDISHQPSGLRYPNSYETIFFAQKGRRKLTFPGQKNVLSFKPTSSHSKIHPVERPISLEHLLITQSTVQGEKVLIPFGGSGVDARAAIMAKRQFTIFELSDHHYNTMYSSIMGFIEQEKEDMQEDLPSEEELRTLADDDMGNLVFLVPESDFSDEEIDDIRITLDKCDILCVSRIKNDEHWLAVPSESKEDALKVLHNISK
jgi:hypothetical protein